MSDKFQEATDGHNIDLGGNFTLLVNELDNDTLASVLVTSYATASSENRAGDVRAALEERLDAIKLEHTPDAET